MRRFSAGLIALAPYILLGFQASHYEAPALNRATFRRAGGPGVLPGGRLISPLGRQFVTGPGTFGLGIGLGGLFATANLGPERQSFTVWEIDKKAQWTSHNYLAAKPAGPSLEKEDEQELRSVSFGLAFSGKQLWLAEGNSGKVRSLDPANGERHKLVSLDGAGFRDSFSGDLAIDEARGILFVTDQANFRVCAIDMKKGRLISGVRVGKLPFAIGLSPDGKTAFVTNVGGFDYQPIRPPISFPTGTAPALQGEDSLQSNSVAIIDVSNAAAMTVTGYVQTGKPFGGNIVGGSSPSGIAAGEGLVYISNAHDDTVTVIDAGTRKIVSQIELSVPGLKALRGVMPIGLALDSEGGRLLVAEAGINAVGVIDIKTRKVLGQIPVGWFPTRVSIANGTIYTANAKGAGTGLNLPGRESYQDGSGLVDVLRRGTVSVFPSPSDAELPKLTQTVWANNGLLPVRGAAPSIPSAVTHVVVIVKENRSFDDIFGDVTSASNGPVAGAPPLARFGSAGTVQGGRERLSLQHVEITPNHHDLAHRWGMSDNFYSDAEVSVDGHHWLVGNYPDPWTESSLMAAYAGQKDFRLPTAAPGRLSFAQSNASVHPGEVQQAGTLWHHLERNQISFRSFGEGFELAGAQDGEKPTGLRFFTNVPMPDVLYSRTSRDYPAFNLNISDQYRASQLIAELKEKPLPQFLFINLPNDHGAPARPADGYPYPASFVADNDYALGRIVEFLSHTPEWKEMAIFVTEADAAGGRDHIDSHRTLLLAIGPYIRKNFVLHLNSSFPGLLKTAFRVFGLPPLNLYDAAAMDLSAMFTDVPDFSPYVARKPDNRIYTER